MRHFDPERYGGEGVKDAADAELAGHYDRIDAHERVRHTDLGERRVRRHRCRAGKEVEPHPGGTRYVVTGAGSVGCDFAWCSRK